MTATKSRPSWFPPAFEKLVTFCKHRIEMNAARRRFPQLRLANGSRSRRLIGAVLLIACLAGGVNAEDFSLDSSSRPHGTERHWSLISPRRPEPPKVRDQSRVRNPVDAFVIAQLEANGLSISDPADRTTLIRRAYFDLIGLPPSPQEIDAFLADQAVDAYERLIDRLLDNPHYGERWGRHWLDLAGYSDSRGILVGEVPRPTHYLYRDYVIRAFQNDKPYDRFLLEQIAGDELVDFQSVARSVIDIPADVADAVIATGFLRNSADASRPDFVAIKHAPMYYYDTLNDAIAIVGSSMLGLTVQCAKCHDHKYDPISQREFYKIQAVFKSGYRPDQWIPEENRFIELASDVEKQRAAEHNRQVQAEIDTLRAESNATQRQYSDRLFAERLAKLPEQIREDVKQAFEQAAGADEKSRNEIQKYLFAKFQKELRPPLDELLKEPDFKAKFIEAAAAIAQREAKKRVFTKIRALYDLAGEPDTHVMKRGDWRSPGDAVEPGVPEAIAAPLPYTCAAIAKELGDVSASGATPEPNPKDSTVNRVAATSSGRRLAFARWLTQPEHPLTARVMVNRVWLHHFGEGLVATPDDFGTRGSMPSHPELLDWLATEFVARGWSVKAIHRLIMTSNVYRQSGHVANDRGAGRIELELTTSTSGRAPADLADPSNRLLWRFPLRRLDAESIRDSVLAASGSLNRKQFGPSIPLVTRNDGEVVAPDGPEGLRRSIYLFVGRKVPVTMLYLFDQPMISVNCTRRSTSTLASQALDLLNSSFMIEQAARFADRIVSEAAPPGLGDLQWDPSQAIRFAFQASLGRAPSASELADSISFLNKQTAIYISSVQSGTATGEQVNKAQRRAMADFAQMLFSANEFVYVD